MPLKLLCPVISGGDLSSDANSRVITRSLRQLDAIVGSEPTYFGQEVRLAFRHLRVLESTTAMGGQEDVRIQLLRRIFTRPASEPILFSVWRRFLSRGQSADDYEALLSMLSNKRITLAETRMRTAGVGEEVMFFEDRNSAPTWLRDIEHSNNVAGCGVKRAVYAYVRTVFAHPFSDGNGRAARAVLQFSLGAEGLLSGPKLTVAPTFYMHWEAMTAHLRDLSRNGSWPGYFDAVLPLLEKAISASREDAEGQRA